MSPSPAPESRPTRRGYIDWLRGLAVLIMIEAHVVDSWASMSARTLPWFRRALFLGGFGAPAFLFLAGLSVALAAEARSRHDGPAAASAGIRRRGWQIFGLAFLFRLQAIVLSGGRLGHLLKVDVLNIMGPGIVAAAIVWERARTTTGRLVAFCTLTAAVSLSTVPVRGAAWLAALPDPVESYLRPVPGVSTFTFFPWVGFLLAGAAVGTLLTTARDAATERRVVSGLAAGGGLAALAVYAVSILTSLADSPSFWTSSPVFFVFRVGVLLAMVGVARLWDRRPEPRRPSPLQQFGRTSLFVYWIHVEMVYGWMSSPWRQELSLPALTLAYAAFTTFLYALSLAKTRVAERYAGGQRPAPRPLMPAAPR